MIIAIADVADPLLDSRVFLKAGSFNAGASATFNATQETAERGCIS